VRPYDRLADVKRPRFVRPKAKPEPAFHHHPSVGDMQGMRNAEMRAPHSAFLENIDPKDAQADFSCSDYLAKSVVQDPLG